MGLNSVLSHFNSRALRLRDCARGSYTIEFALLFPIFVAIVLATFQVTIIFVAQSYLEAAAEAGARIVLTNQADGMTQAQFNTAICGQIAALFNCNNLIVALQTAPTSASGMAAALPSFDSHGALLNPTSFSVAAAPAKMMLVVMYQWPVFGGPLSLNLSNLGNGTHLLISTQVFQVEPYSG